MHIFRFQNESEQHVYILQFAHIVNVHLEDVYLNKQAKHVYFSAWLLFVSIRVVLHQRRAGRMGADYRLALTIG